MSSDGTPKRLLVATGDDWALWWPQDKWQALAPDERRHVVQRQRQLLEKPTRKGGDRQNGEARS